MNLLARINGEALAVPGLRIYGRRDHGRSAIIAQDAHGATELWCDDKREWGGIELHSPVDWGRFDGDGAPTIEDCEILNGPCWSDGSLSAWNRDFLPRIQVRDSEGVLRELVRWHRDHFGDAHIWRRVGQT